jgi:3-phosphoshikimate 1-carboxyvinyltransferase
MGCTVHADESGVRVSRDPEHRLRGVDVDMAEISDLVPTLAVLGACAEGTTRIRGVGFIRAKESDRLGDLASELRKCGVDVSVADDGLDVRGGPLQAASIEPHHDHRLAMSLALLGMCRDGIEVRDPDVVSKSWPSFWTSMQGGLGIG